jgi:non-homologous end joining protein Ku
MISEIDIEDMKALYELDKGTMFKLAKQDVVSVPPDSESFQTTDVFKFMGIDGMYSKCLDSTGTMHHFAAWTKVVPWNV